MILTVATIASIAADIKLAVEAAQYAAPVVKQIRDGINELFGKGFISAEYQNQLHSYVDGLMVAAISRVAPESWTVQPDPQ